LSRFKNPPKPLHFQISLSGEILPIKRNGGGVTHTQLSSKTLVRLFTGLDDHQNLTTLTASPLELSM
jgi:hypothetical protein